MADRDKVIAALGHCSTVQTCKKCPMADECRGYHNAAMAEAIRLLKQDAARDVMLIPCAECRHWDPESGLSARKCLKHGILTTQRDFCSRPERKCDG